jgi:hypothetical protein
MLRTHDVVLADGTFRVVITPKRRVIAALDVHESLLGPLHLAFEIDRAPFLPPHVSPAVLERSIATAGVFDDIGHTVSKAAEGTFHAATHAASTVAHPMFGLVKGAAAQGMHALGDVAHPLEAAAHVVMRAKLGDLNAKQFIKSMATAAKAGVHAAMHVSDTLLDASKLVAKAMDVPTIITSQIPILNQVMKSISPYEAYQHMVTALQHGDLKEMEKIAKSEITLAQSVVSLVPGVGTGISAALGAGVAALEGGNPIELAIRIAYGAIPIPPGIRQITDTVVDGVLALIEHPHDLTDVVVQIARDKVPHGLPRDVFDTLVQLIVKRMPIQKVAGGLVEHYVSQYAPAFAGHGLDAAMKGLHVDPSAVAHIADVAHAAPVAAISRGARMIQPLPFFGHG